MKYNLKQTKTVQELSEKEDYVSLHDEIQGLSCRELAIRIMDTCWHHFPVRSEGMLLIEEAVDRLNKKEAGK